MELVRIAIIAFTSLIILFLLTKIMGDRQMSELSMFDYINSITIGSIAAEMATTTTVHEAAKPLVAMIVYGILTFLISYITCKSIVLRRFFEGHSILVYKNGQIYDKNLLKRKLDVDEFLSLCRASGYFDLEEIHTAIMEANGKLSVIPKSDHRPATPSDLNLNPAQNDALANVIVDGHIMKDNLKSTGKDEKWVEKQMSAHGVTDIKEILLATYDGTKNKLNFYVKLNEKMTRDIFE